MLRTTEVSEPKLTATMHTDPAATGAERRHDAQTVEEVIALAAQMQAEHQETLSTEELETIAVEAGIRPEFVRRALALVETQKTGVQTRGRRTQNRRAMTTEKRTWGIGPRKTLMYGLPAAYCVPLFPIACALLGPNYINFQYAETLTYLFGIFLPGLLALFLGATLRKKRQGIIAGAWLGFCVLFTAFLASMIQAPASLNDLDGFFRALLVVTAGGAALGLIGALLPPLADYIAGEKQDADEDDGRDA